MHVTRVLGTGSYLPDRILTNKDLEKMVDTNDEWVLERTGISSRRIAAADQATSDLGVEAAKRAMDAAGVSPADIDVIIFASVTSDQVMPSAACCLQAKLGCRTVMSFDLAAACSGFLYGMSVGDSFIRTGLYKTVLVVGAEVLSRFVDYKDRATCILFGDGAGAFVLGRGAPGDAAKSGVLAQYHASDGNLGDILKLPGGGSRFPASAQTLQENLHVVQMKGREVFKAAVRAMELGCRTTIAQAGISMEEIDWFVPHQANRRIIEGLGDALGFPNERLVTNVNVTGNTSSASIPIAFDQAVRDGRIQRGQTILMSAFGGGVTSGSMILQY
jgi:3-oxoacyl-[acyl-carrier-protein] synthase-3